MSHGWPCGRKKEWSWRWCNDKKIMHGNEADKRLVRDSHCFACSGPSGCQNWAFDSSKGAQLKGACKRVQMSVKRPEKHELIAVQKPENSRAVQKR